ncbi:hypothetical protein [Streptomyces sp. NPDC046925]|uniref:hypothetical protein n=1 Tax=Streptomyces sp. NPDC046925 TaxID=3155375 RepID=UPI0033F37A78
MSQHTAPGPDVIRARLRETAQHALGARLALETDPHLQRYDVLDVIDDHLERAAHFLRQGNALSAHYSVTSARGTLAAHPMFRIHARRPGEDHLPAGEQIAVVGSVRDRDQVLAQLQAAGWHFTSTALEPLHWGDGLPPLTGPITLPGGAHLERRLTHGLPPGLTAPALRALLERLSAVWHEAEEQEQMCPLWYTVANRASLPVLEGLPAAHETFVWDLLYPHGVHTEPLDCPRASDLRALIEQLGTGAEGPASEGPAADRAAASGPEGTPDLVAELADLRGRFEDGYTPEGIRSVFGRIQDAGGPYLVCVWEYADAFGFGGNSEFYAETAGGFYEVSPDIHGWLSGDLETPGAPDTWVCAPLSQPLEFTVTDDFHNYARTEA